MSEKQIKEEFLQRLADAESNTAWNTICDEVKTYTKTLPEEERSGANPLWWFVLSTLRFKVGKEKEVILECLRRSVGIMGEKTKEDCEFWDNEDQELLDEATLDKTAVWDSDLDD